jgi:hypothetical protein
MLMQIFGADLPSLSGFPFPVRYVTGSQVRAAAVAGIAADAYAYLAGLLDDVEPDIAVIVADRAVWPSTVTPYGMPFFRDDPGQLRPGILVLPAGAGDFWREAIDELPHDDPAGWQRLCRTYPDPARGGVDLQPFFDLVTVHELGHAFETLGGLRLPAFWLSELFANLALHAFVATRIPGSLETLQAFSEVGAADRGLTARIHATGISALDAFEEHYAGSRDQMSTQNYLWFQYRFQRLAADVFEADGQDALVRFWRLFRDRRAPAQTDAASLAPVLAEHVSAELGAGIADW